MIEVLKQALDALETELFIDWTNNDEFNASAEKMHDAITSLQQAIKKLESQEPVLWMMPDGKTADKWALQFYGGQKGKPLYTTPPQRTWQGLTDDEHCDIWYKESLDWMEYGKAIEAKLKQKNGYAEEKNND